MTVVRELVTRLSFAFDKTNLNKFEQSISGFKTRFDIFNLAVKNTVGRLFEFTTGIADAAIQTKDLADYSGIALTDFIALRNAAAKLSLPAESFNSAIEKISINIKQASRGFGELFQIVKETNGRVNFKDLNGDLLNAKDVLFQIFDEVNRISDRSEKLRILGNFFDPQSAGAWLRVIEKGRAEFEKLVIAEQAGAKAQADQSDSLIEYRKQVSAIAVEWEQVYQTIASYVAPKLLDVLQQTNKIITATKAGGSTFSSFWKALGDIGGRINSPQDAIDLMSGQFQQKRIQREKLDVENSVDLRRAQEFEANRASNNNNSATFNNKFEFNVPPGTTEQTANFMSEAIRLTLNDLWTEKTREVFANNPQVE